MRFLDSFSMVDHCTWHHWTEWVAICVPIQTPVLQRMKEKPKKNMMIKTLTSITWMIARLINWFTDWFADWSIDWWVSWLVDWLLLWLLLWLLHWQNDRLIDGLLDWVIHSLISFAVWTDMQVCPLWRKYEMLRKENVRHTLWIKRYICSIILEFKRYEMPYYRTGRICIWHAKCVFGIIFV